MITFISMTLLLVNMDVIGTQLATCKHNHFTSWIWANPITMLYLTKGWVMVEKE